MPSMASPEKLAQLDAFAEETGARHANQNNSDGNPCDDHHSFSCKVGYFHMAFIIPPDLANI